MTDAAHHIISLSPYEYYQISVVAFSIIGAIIYEIYLRRKDEAEILEIRRKAEQKRKKEEKENRMVTYQRRGMPGLIKHKEEFIRQEKHILDQQCESATANLTYEKYLSLRREFIGHHINERQKYENILKEWIRENLGPEKFHHYEMEIKYEYEKEFNKTFKKNPGGTFELLKCVEFFLEEMNRKLGCPYWGLSENGGAEGVRCYENEVMQKRKMSLEILTDWGKRHLDPEHLKRLKASEDKWVIIKEKQEKEKDQWCSVFAEEGVEGILNLYREKILEINGLYADQNQSIDRYYAQMKFWIRLRMWSEQYEDKQLQNEIWRVLD